jgi:dTDP-4-dehydrorhamnose reductase
MKALIFGAEGQLGRELAKTAPEGWQILALGRKQFDIVDDEAVNAIIGRERPNIVINAAAFTDVDAAESEEAKAFRINAEAPGNIASACERHGARFIHISTDYVFGGEGDTPFKPGDRPTPLGAYGRSKLAGEETVLAYPDTLVVRSAWIYAAHGRNFLDTMLRLMAERDEIAVVADQTGTPTHARSLARAIWALAEAGATGIHHFTDAGATTWHGFASAIEEEARKLGLITGCTVRPIATADYPTPARRPACSVLDCSAAWAITGRPRDWRDELAGVLAERKATA